MTGEQSGRATVTGEQVLIKGRGEGEDRRGKGEDNYTATLPLQSARYSVE
jgi:hypothetical protein